MSADCLLDFDVVAMSKDFALSSCGHGVDVDAKSSSRHEKSTLTQSVEALMPCDDVTDVVRCCHCCSLLAVLHYCLLTVPSVLRRCWEERLFCKKTCDEVLLWLSVCSEV